MISDGEGGSAYNIEESRYEIPAYKVDELAMAGAIAPNTDSMESATEIEFMTAVHITAGENMIQVPNETVLTSESSANFSELAASDEPDTDDLPDGLTALGAISFGLDSVGLSSSEAITMLIGIDSEYNGDTLAVYQKEASDPWESFTTCVVDESVCEFETETLSSFAVVSDGEVVEEEEESNSSPKRGGSVRSRVARLTETGKNAAADALKAKYPALFAKFGGAAGGTTGASTGSSGTSGSSTSMSVRDLELGMEGADVRMLQEILIGRNEGPMAVALAGIGATSYFGTYTRDALAEYQGLYGIVPPIGYFGIITRTQMKGAGLTGLWW